MYSRTPPTVYAVHWANINVFKFGYSDCQRYRLFLNRGAELLGLFEFGTVTAGLDFETLVDESAMAICRPGFRTRDSADPYLGGRGAGYLECYRTPADLMPSEVIPYVFSNALSMLGASAEHMPESCSVDASSNPRTYGRTDVQPPTLASYLTLGIARRGVARFSPSRSETTGPAALRAGRIKAGSHA